MGATIVEFMFGVREGTMSSRSSESCHWRAGLAASCIWVFGCILRETLMPRFKKWSGPGEGFFAAASLLPDFRLLMRRTQTATRLNFGMSEYWL